jgi:hypothetical protein
VISDSALENFPTATWISNEFPANPCRRSAGMKMLASRRLSLIWLALSWLATCIAGARRGWIIAAFTAFTSILPVQAGAATAREGAAAFSRGDYPRASSILIPLAERGDPVAQAYLGFMFETGRGVPQNYSEAAMWFRRSAEQGNGAAQYSLGLLYDKGFGVPRDEVEAHRWLNLATSIASPRDRERRERIRDAIASKLSREEIALSRTRALEWAPSREH